MAASPEFFQPAYTPRLFLAVASAAAADQDDAYYHCHTPKGAEISFLGRPATCPPAPMKPRPPPASACRKRLFAAAARDIIKLNFDDLRPCSAPPLSDDKKQQQRRRRSTRRSVLGAAFVAN